MIRHAIPWLGCAIALCACSQNSAPPGGTAGFPGTSQQTQPAQTSSSGTTAAPPTAASPAAIAGASGATATPIAGTASAGRAAPVAGSSAAASGAGVAAPGSMDDDGGVAMDGSIATDGSMPPADAAVATQGPDAAVSECPDVPPLKSGDTTMSLQHDGRMRQYIVHVPPGYDGKTPVPLMFDFHGWQSAADREEGASGWREKADAVGFIMVYPIGLSASWNGGALCCGTSQSTGVDDEGFALAMVKKMQSDACIDPKRIYVGGISNGGAMTHLLACKHADVFAAAAPVSMGNGTTPCNPSRPISVVMIRGIMDELVAYNGGLFPSAQADFNMWKSLNGCTGSPMTTHTVCQTYTECKAGVEVTLCSLPNGMHNVYQDKAELSVADVAWEAFERQRLP